MVRHGFIDVGNCIFSTFLNETLNYLGNMVLIKRGGCSFMEKSYNAQNHGAVGAIIYNNDENDIDSNIDMVNDESGRQIDIPVLWLVGRNGHMMVDSMLDVSQTRVANPLLLWLETQYESPIFRPEKSFSYNYNF